MTATHPDRYERRGEVAGNKNGSGGGSGSRNRNRGQTQNKIHELLSTPSQSAMMDADLRSTLSIPSSASIKITITALKSSRTRKDTDSGGGANTVAMTENELHADMPTPISGSRNRATEHDGVDPHTHIHRLSAQMKELDGLFPRDGGHMLSNMVRTEGCDSRGRIRGYNKDNDVEVMGVGEWSGVRGRMKDESEFGRRVRDRFWGDGKEMAAGSCSSVRA